jgi:hypothetical protein
MKSTDKILIGIVIGIIMLIIVALIVTLTQPDPTYQSEDTPKGVAHNYLLALQKEEYDRAYIYLSPTIKSYPTSLDEFTDQIRNDAWRFRLSTNSTLSVESAKINGDRATVTVQESSFRSGDLFNNTQSSRSFDMELILANEEWKIFDSVYYFAWCWNQTQGCK